MVARGAAPGTGTGSMTLQVDNRRTLRPETCEQGTIAFLFDNTQPAATLDVMLHQFANANPQNAFCKHETPHDVTYHYDRSDGGAGHFLFLVQGNIHNALENKPKLEELSVRSRWTGAGAGRSDVRITGGEVTTDLQAAGFKDTSVTASQCWDASFKSVYETSSPPNLGILAEAGDPQKCAFTSQMLPN